MASSAPKVAPPERRDPLSVVDKQADEIVALIKKSKHFIVFTGAGVSTSAGKSNNRTFLCSSAVD
jgi:formylmethanofuran dehydrogenase subunit B